MGFRLPGSSVHLPEAQQSQLEQRQRQHDHEQDNADGGGVADIDQLYTLVEYIGDHGFSAVQWPTSGGQHVHGVEDLERTDDGDHQHEQGRGAQHRQGNAPEDLPGGGPVHAGGFVEVLRYPLQACEEDHHVEAEVLPDTDQDHNGHGPVGVTQPACNGHSDGMEPVSQEADVGVEQEAPYHRDDGEGTDHRQKEGGTQEPAQWQLTV